MNILFSLPCPHCQKNISLPRLMLALSKQRFLCSHCRTSIYSTGTGFLRFLVTFIIGSAILMYIYQYVTRTGSFSGISPWYIFGGFLVIEAINSLILCNMTQILPYKKGSSKNKDHLSDQTDLDKPDQT